MGVNNNRQDLIDYLIKNGLNDSWKNLSIKFKIESSEVARAIWKRYRSNNKKNFGTEYHPDTVAFKKSSFEENMESGTAEGTFVVSKAIRDLSDLEELIDTEKWTITKYVQNFWGNEENPKYQVKAWMTLKVPTVETSVINLLDTYKSSYVPITAKNILNNSQFDNACCLYLALTDIHLNKQTVDGQTIEDKIKRYHEVLNNLLYRSYHSYNIDEIVFTIGHDMFNTDTYYKTTTNGTQQYNNAEFDKSYELIFDCQVNAINKLKQFCKTLHIKHIPSNHARTQEYFLVHALEVYFKNDPSIIFDRTADSTKVYVYGENFIGMHHGDTKLEKLPLFFAQKYYKEWGAAKYKEIGVGDKHTRKSWNTDSTEVEGVRVFMTPHMGGHGQWDKDQMFDNGIQGGICRVYDKQKGKIAEMEERV